MRQSVMQVAYRRRRRQCDSGFRGDAKYSVTQFRVENLEDALDHIGEVLRRVKKEHLQTAYKIENWLDEEDFLIKLCKLTIKLYKVHSAPSSHVDTLAGDGHHRTTAATKEDFSQRKLSTLHKEILQSKTERINQLLETGHENFAHADTRKGQLDDSGYDSISNEVQSQFAKK